jgi:tetratricopeptide (TPR) repeat protein
MNSFAKHTDLSVNYKSGGDIRHNQERSILHILMHMLNTRRLAVLLLCFLSIIHLVQAQHTLRIEVNDFLGAENIFLSGDINHWKPNDESYKLKRINYFRTEITLHNLPAGQYAFKLTKGSAETVETTANGEDIPNRVINLHSDTTVLFGVQGWKDKMTSPDRFTDSARLAHALDRGFHYLKTNVDSSFKYALETFALSARVSPEMKAYATNLQGEMLLQLGNTEKALELFKEGLRIRLSWDNPMDSGGISFLYNQVGDVYWHSKDTTQAVENYRLSMRWTPAYAYFHPLHEGICSRLCNMGRACLGRHQIDSAKWYATQSARVGDRVSSLTDLFWGDIAQSEAKHLAAISYFRSAARLAVHHDHNLDIALQSYQRLAQAFAATHQRDSAMVYARRAFAIANELHENASIGRTGLALASLFRDRGSYDSALFYQQKVIESLEKQFSSEKERQALNTYFNGKIREQDVVAKKKEYYSTLWLYGLFGGLLVLVLLAIFFRIRLKSRYDRKMKEIEMRALRAQMNPHFIFNCLGSINRYIVKSDTKTASNYLTKFAKLIRLILDNSSSDHISLNAEIQTLQLYLDMESLRFDGGFDYEIQKGENLEEDSICLPSMLIQPYVENAIWHGLLQKEERGKLWIRFKKISGHTLQAEIEDNGIGRKNAAELKSKDAIRQKSYGMQVSSDRIKIINNLYKLNNSVTVHDLFDERGGATGTKIVLKIPVS